MRSGRAWSSAEELAPDQHGEFVIGVAVVALTALAIETLAVWLAKNRSQGNVVEEEVTLASRTARG